LPEFRNERDLIEAPATGVQFVRIDIPSSEEAPEVCCQLELAARRAASFSHCTG
jgi:hypothetical protein